MLAQPLPAAFAETVTVHTTIGGTTSNNADAQNYGSPLIASNSSKPVNSYLVANSDGTISRIEYISASDGSNGHIVVEKYDASFNLQSSKTVEMELPVFGGFYEGTGYFFVVEGQNNSAQNDSVETFRIIKYDKKWTRAGSVSVNASNTTVPFSAGACRMAQSGDMLYIRTCHEMYIGDQANITFAVKISTMQITDQRTDPGNAAGDGYVSHSFNQFIAIDPADSTIVALDHGDTYPRSLVLNRFVAKAGSEKLVTDVYHSTEPLDAVKIYSKGVSLGTNSTGASIGGLEISGSNYLIAYDSVIQDIRSTYASEGFNKRRTLNVYIAAVDKTAYSESGITTTNLSGYDDREYADASKASEHSTSTPQIVKVDGDKYMVLWQVFDKYTWDNSGTTMYSYQASNIFSYVLVDGSGKPLSEVMNCQGWISDCAPIVFNGQVVWYSTSDSAPTFYTLPVAADYSVTLDFDGNGGTVSASKIQTSYDGVKKLGTLPNASRPSVRGASLSGVNLGTAYTLEGWYTDASAGTKISSGDIVPNLRYVKLFAHWKATSWKRVYGADRFATMLNLYDQYGGENDTIIVANGFGFADALAAAGLSGLVDAPIVLTDKGSLPSGVWSNIKYGNWKVKKAIIVGGISVVSDSVKAQLESLGVSVVRYSGSDRYATALDIYAKKKGSWGNTAIVATGADFADALSISPFAYVKRAPIFLSSPADGLTQGELDALRSGSFSQVIIVGGAQAVSNSVASDITAATGLVPTRLEGADRYQTSAAIANYALANGLAASSLSVATGRGAADALAGSAVCGKKESVLVLVDDAHAWSDGDYAIDHVIKPNSALVDAGMVFGGTKAVSSEVVQQITGIEGL